MERHISIKLSVAYTIVLSNKIMTLAGVQNVEFHTDRSNIELTEFVIHYKDDHKGDPWFDGVQIGMLALEAINAYKFGIQLDMYSGPARSQP